MPPQAESTAAMSATSRLVSEVLMMSEEQFRQEKLYQITMSIIRQMRKTRLITDEEYRQLDTIFAQKYEPIFGGLYAGTDLL